MRYGSVCSGIEAATTAWEPLGWQPSFFSEIEAFPRAVLAHHYPSIPLHGDFTTIEAGQYEPIDLLVGGTPCQSFSVAGLRGGLADERGNLALEFLRLADRLRPRWVVWENIPGVLSSHSHDAPDPCQPPDDMEEGAEWVGEDEYDADESHAFACFLAGLSDLGYGFAYGVLDAQFFGLAQRRNRMFVVGYLGDWRRAAAVLFEPASLRGDPAPRRKAGEVAANALTERPDRGGGNSEGQRLIAPPLTHNPYGDHESREGLLVANPLGSKKDGGWRGDLDNDTYVAHSLRGEGFDASEDGTGRGTPLIATTLRARDGAKGVDSDCTDTLIAQPYTLAIRGRGDSHDLEYRQDGTSNALLTPNGGRAGIGVGAVAYAIQERAVCENASAGPDGAGFRADVSYTLEARSVPQAVAFDARQSDVLQYGERSGPLDTDGTSMGLLHRSAVRRLTPRECERLQGFPDDYTLIRYRGKLAADGPRYRALGNSMAVPCMAWIGRRIDAQEAEIQAATGVAA